MSSPNCFGAIQVAATRVAALNPNGSPLTGAGNGYVTSNLMTVTIAPVLDKGADETLKNASNNICQQYEDCDRLKSITITLELCSFEPDFAHLIAGGLSFPGSGPGAAKTLGWQFPQVTDACTNGVCLEFWQLAWDGDSQAIPTSVFANNNTLAYWHHVYPRVLFQLADMKGETKFTVFKFVGTARINPKVTANGPFDDWPTGVTNFGGITGLGGIFEDSTVPTGACSLISVPSSDS